MSDPTPPPDDLPPVDAAEVEAALFSSRVPLSAARLADVLGRPNPRGVREAVERLNAKYERDGRSFAIEPVAGGFVLMTRPRFAEVLARLHRREQDARLTPALLETLSVVAYKQPVLRAEVEAIRGVACGEALRGLMERHLVRVAGRAEEPGRPMLYGTTRRFLEVFGLHSTRDLPKPGEAAGR